MNSTSCLIMFLVASVAVFELVAGEDTDEMKEWTKIREDVKKNKLKRRICDSIISEAEWGHLKLDKVKVIFEEALEHIAKASDSVSQMKAKVEPELVDTYYTNGAELVLKISNKRRDLINGFEEGLRKKVGEKKLQSLLEDAALFACASIKGAILSEETMRKAAARVNGE